MMQPKVGQIWKIPSLDFIGQFHYIFIEKLEIEKDSETWIDFSYLGKSNDEPLDFVKLTTLMSIGDFISG